MAVTLLNAKAAGGTAGAASAVGSATDAANTGIAFTHDDSDVMMRDAHTGDSGGGGGSGARAGGALQCLLDALDSALDGQAKCEAEMVEILSVLGAPAVADAALTVAATMAVVRAGAAPVGGGADSDDDETLDPFAPATRTVGRLVQLCRLSSSPARPSSVPASEHRVSRAAAVALVSFAIAAYRKAAPSGGLFPVGPRERETIVVMAESATGAVLDSRPVAAIFRSNAGTKRNRGGDFGGGIGAGRDDGGTGVMSAARVMLPQLRVLAIAHTQPRHKVCRKPPNLGGAGGMFQARMGQVHAVSCQSYARGRPAVLSSV